MEPQEEFKPKIDYNNCLTNVACSIQKYFEIPQRHKGLPEIDKLFAEKQPENVILILCDGLGSRVMDVALNKDDYMMKKRVKEIYATFPSTTASGLTSIKTGLNPAEHGWIGWFVYIKPIDKIIKIYKDKDKDAYIFSNSDFIKIKEKYLTPKTIVEQINEAKKYKAFETNCYPHNEESDLDIVFENILDKLKIEGKKYIFSYIGEPDHILHSKGTFHEKAKREIQNINKKVEEYSKKILEYKNTVMIIVADHGHIVAEEINIKSKDYMKYVANEQSFIECRAPAYLVKKGEEENFKKAFLKDFGNDFYLLSKEEVLKYQLFGDYEEGNENPLFKDGLGDFMGVSKGNTNKALLGKADWGKVGYHGGNSDEEVFVPLIIINN